MILFHSLYKTTPGGGRGKEKHGNSPVAHAGDGKPCLEDYL